MSVLFTPLRLRDLEMRNRIWVSPMCEYSCEDQDGLANDWHLVHLGSRAVGGAGLVMTEAAAVTEDGRISPYDLGIWSDAHADALLPSTRFIEANGAASAIQLAHAGRKASTNRPWAGGKPVDASEGGWEPSGPSPLPYAPGYAEPHAYSTAEVRGVIDAFAAATVRSARAGFKAVEIHAAHGYLLHQFLSPSPTSAPTSSAATSTAARASPAMSRAQCAIRSRANSRCSCASPPASTSRAGGTSMTRWNSPAA
jgi:2,4-dienoyl-CoA reductase-like NADH-dependent reductase (Old Yellow Enzyme family)